MTNRLSPPWVTIALISMTSLAYEILLMRLFSIIQWHHFAYMIISLALIGYGASGTFLTIFRKNLLENYRTAFIGNSLLFSIGILLCFHISQHIQFNIEQMLWDTSQFGRLIVVYLLLAFPFFFVANAIGLTLAKFPIHMPRLYAADLFGAGTGSVIVIIVLYKLLPESGLELLSGIALITTVIGLIELGSIRQSRVVLFVCLLSLFSLILLPQAWTKLNISPYKGLMQSLNVSGTKIVDTKSSPLGLLNVVESKTVPFRHAPGLSIQSTASIPEQVAVFFDADAMSIITHKPQIQDMSYLEQMTSSLPYHLSNIESALILGAGGGSEVLQALHYQVARIKAVELNPDVIDLVLNDFKEYSGQIYDDPRVELVIDEARGFISADKGVYDLIQLSLFDSYNASSAGLYALSESYMYTVEALQASINRLSNSGYLVISRWLRLPARDTFKLFNTAIDALKANGIQEPKNHLLVIRGLQTSTLVIKKTLLNQQDIQNLKIFTQKNAFDLAYYPNMPEFEANQYNVLAQPYFYQGFRSLVGEQSLKFIEDYKFNIQAASDDKPFFFQFFKWAVLPEFVSLMGQGGMPLFEWGYLILVATFVQALIASVLLILLPLLFVKKRFKDQSNKSYNLSSFFYFMSLGLAFLFIEIAFIQKFILFLHHPTFSISVVLASFLIFAGMGSQWSNRYSTSNKQCLGIFTAVKYMIAVGIIYLIVLEPIFLTLISLPIAIKILISVLLIAPLAFLMGMPFPLGLSMIAIKSPHLVPWVWGVNGCASVLSAVLASLLAIHFGFSIVIVSALVLYAVAVFSARSWI